MPGKVGRPKKEPAPYRPTVDDLVEELRRRERCRWYRYFADGGAMARVGYPKHLAFMRAGAKWRQRAMCAANRVGKSDVAAYEITCHLTGMYPAWWEGRRFDKPTEWWAAGDTAQTTRDIMQVAFLGPTNVLESRQWAGMIPATLVHDVARKPGVPGGVTTIWVKHASGGMSSVELKCHPAGSRVLMADGTWARIEAIRLGDMVRCPDGAARSVTRTYAYADADVLAIETRAGVIEATPNHPCHTDNRQWVDAGDLRVGDVLTEVHFPPDQCVPQEDWRVKITALMIGDGCARGKTPFFTCNEQPIVDAVKAVLPDDLCVVPVRNTINYKISTKLYKQNRLKNALVEDGLWGKKSTSKFIPPWVFRLPEHQRIDFLRWLWGCDGSINARMAYYSTASPRLAEDVRLLLMSVGIRVPLKHRKVGNRSKKLFDAWTLDLYGHNRLRFDRIGKLNRNVEVKVTPRPNGPTGEILSIASVGKKNVYCVGVDDVHELIVEGYRVGNSYDQKREAFQGTARAGCWLDEEPPEDIYGECLIRTMTTNGLMVVTFTPLQGLTPFIASWLERSVIEVLGEDGRSQLLPSKGEVFKGLQSADVPDVDAVAGETPKDEAGTRYLIMATWDDAPHLSAEAKAAMLAEFPPHQRDARSKGIPALGSGIIYPVPENEIRVAPFEIPSHWPRAFGMDTDAGAGWTAAVWAAMDPASKTYYLYDVYKRSHAEVAVHAAAIKARGAWIPGVADAAALLVTNQDAQQLIKLYQNEGLDIVLPDKAVEAGIQDVWTLLSSGRLKVFSSCGAFFDEFRLYRRDSKGRIVKQNDHVVDSVRYLCRSGIKRMKMGASTKKPSGGRGIIGTVQSWMG